MVQALLAQDYVSGIFVDDALGRYPGHAAAVGDQPEAARRVTPHPAIVVNFRSYADRLRRSRCCARPNVADTGLQQGQGMHGSFSRADTMNFMAAIGPDFKTGFADEAPVSNADVGKTIAHILRLNITAKGRLVGRIIERSHAGRREPDGASNFVERAKPGQDGLAHRAGYPAVGRTRYFDAAGFPGRTVGLDESKAASR